MSDTGKMSLESAENIARAIVEKLSPFCTKIEVVGSIRRRCPWVGDIDLVLIPSDPWKLHHAILSLGATKAAGSKIMRTRVGMADVDIYFATQESWATLLLIRTGSTENNIRLCQRAKDRGWHLHADGAGLFNEKGERIAGDTEFSIYQALELPFQKPEQRN